MQVSERAQSPRHTNQISRPVPNAASGPNAQLAALHGPGSHDIGLVDVLALAAQLCRLPKEVIIGCAEGETSTPATPLSLAGLAAVARLADEISEMLPQPAGDAR